MLLSGLLVFLLVGLNEGLLVGLIVGFLFVQSGGWAEIKLTETLTWSWNDGLRNGLSVGLIVGVSSGLVFILLGSLSVIQSDILTGGLSDVLSGVLIGGLSGVLSGILTGGLKSKELQIKSTPNQGIILSGRNSLSVVVGGGLLGGLFFGLLSLLLGGLNDNLSLVMGGILLGGLSGGLLYGGGAYITHYLLRWFLARNNHLPLKLVYFLDKMADHIILRKVGGGYIFIHRLLLEYFASLETEP